MTSEFGSRRLLLFGEMLPGGDHLGDCQRQNVPEKAPTDYHWRVESPSDAPLGRLSSDSQ